MPGTIVFKPLEANIVSKDKDLIGKMDPYLSFHLGGLKRVKTEVAKSGGQHPIWNDAVSVEVTDQTSLTVDLKDKDMLIDDKIGSFEVDLREVQSQGRVRKWYPIFRKNEPAGELLMEATFSGGNLGQYGQTGLSQPGQYGTYGGVSQQGQYGQSGLTQGQYGTSGLSQGQYGTSGLSQGQYGTSGLSQGQYTSNLTSGTTGGYIGGIYGQPQSGHVITTPGTIISQTSTSYPVKTTGQTSQYTSGTHSTQYSGSQYSSGLQQGQYGGVTSQYGAIPQSQYGSGQLGGVPSQYSNIPQNQFSGISGQYGGFPQTQSYGAPSTEQYAKEALLRGSDPLNTQQNYYHNVGLGGYSGHPQGQNLTQTPSFSGTDPLLYEGDKNRFSNPPQQIPYKGKTVETYGLKHGAHGTGSGSVNPNVNPSNQYY